MIKYHGQEGHLPISRRTFLSTAAAASSSYGAEHLTISSVKAFPIKVAGMAGGALPKFASDFDPARSRWIGPFAQLGGAIPGNPWLATGPARSILNEVHSNDPSLLRGPVEVAGNKAQVIIANPSGITCDGCSFLNAQRTTLTTGVPVFSHGGNLEAYRVHGGTVTLQGKGMDARQADVTDLIAHAVKVNAGLWAQTLNQHIPTIAIMGG